MLQAFYSVSGNTVIPALATSEERLDWKKTGSFSCPECKQPVIFKTGTKVVPHFAHKAKASCQLQGGGEGLYHEKGKLNLYQWLRNQNIAVELEAYLPGIQQRPDLLLTINNKKIALEYQCAPLSAKDFSKRTNGYLTAGVTPIWILGGNRQKRAGINSLFLTASDTVFLHQYNSSFSPVLYYYCSNTDQFAFFHHIFFTGRRKAYGKLQFFSLSAIPFSMLFHWKQQPELFLYKEWRQEMKKMRTRVLSPYHTTEKKWYQWLYAYSLHPSVLPSIIGLPVKSQFKFQIPSPIWQSKLFLELLHPLPVGKSITLDQSRQLVSPYRLTTDALPLIGDNSCPVEEYLDLLVYIGILEKMNGFVYAKRKQIKFPGKVETALQADEVLYAFLSK